MRLKKSYREMEFENAKKAYKIEEHASADADSMPNGRPKRSRVAEQRSRYGSADGTISNSVSLVNNSLTKVQSLMDVLVATPKEVDVVDRPKEVATGDVCQCAHHIDHDKLLRGSTMENAVEIDDDDDDDDDDVRVVAILPRPLLQKTYARLDEGGKFRDAGILTAEEISGHQGRLAVEDDVLGSRMGTDGNSLLQSVHGNVQDAKDALKRLTTKSPGQKSPAEGKPVSGKVKEGNVDDEDDVEERMFLSPRHKKPKDRVYRESDEDELDYEMLSYSDSDRESTPELEDPNEDIWKQVAVIARQSMREDGEEEQALCEHKLEIKNDVGRACSLCGWIKEDIKDMFYIWRPPATVRKDRPSREWSDSWEEDGDVALEEEAQLVGTAALEAHPYLEGQMHPHQTEGFKFLSRNLVQESSGGCMLAFAPGTGKSFLVISFIQSFMVQVPNARPMIVAPKSMLRPWMQEFKKWEVEEITVMNLYEAEDQVEMLQQWQETSSVLLVGYSQWTNMSGEIGKYLTEGPGLLVLDEGHLARTESTKILKALSRVRTKRRVLLSGTPFNNNFEEFYTTLELVRPNFMMRANPQMGPTLNSLIAPEPTTTRSPPLVLRKSSNAGRQAFKDVIGEKFESGQHNNIARALKQLRVLIEPFVAWHKGQILETLPGITDLTIMLDLSSKQRELLKNCKSEVRDSLQKRAAAIYVHPILEPVAEHGKRSQNDPRLKGNIDVTQGVKLRWVLDLLQFCDDAKEKMLIFSEYLYTLKLIENMAAQQMKWSQDVQILRLDGKMPPLEREKVIMNFNTNPDVRMLCASIKACGEGISLVGASRVVILEVMWNPAVTRQAISRAFRIGQQKKVVVYRLIAANTYEEHKMHVAATRKEWLSKLLFDPTISCEDPNSILWDVTNDCSDSFLRDGPLKVGVNRILEREF